MQKMSAGYTYGYGSLSCMFLCEAPLGNMHLVTSDGPHANRLTKPPNGFDSVLAVGRVTPKSWTIMDIDGKSVQVPDSNEHPSGTASSFNHDEFLIYDEAQIRLRYVVTVG